MRRIVLRQFEYLWCWEQPHFYWTMSSFET